jgi:hypothetical protein
MKINSPTMSSDETASYRKYGFGNPANKGHPIVPFL